MAALPWPDGKRFAFSIFDDTDLARPGNYEAAYECLYRCGMRTTKSVWPATGPGLEPRGREGSTCDDAEYLRYVLELQRRGYEIGYHNAYHTGLHRGQVERALDRFRELFGHDPVTMSNHALSREGIYWGAARLSPPLSTLYRLLVARGPGSHVGHVVGSPYFWGDLCQRRIRYVRNFVFGRIDTLASCPWMPYHDPARPYVNAWYAAAHAQHCAHFVDMLSEAHQDALEASGGACIVYTHFAAEFVDASGRLHARVRQLLERLSRKPGWFVPVGTLLDYIAARRGISRLSAAARQSLEWRWLAHKLLVGAG
ncbi:MAG: hypothetical protein JOZ03_07145 [Gammaproteobacteria bacterium]|nr:hypothetical protein [Gammaproteobacteria bacterium]